VKSLLPVLSVIAACAGPAAAPTAATCPRIEAAPAPSAATLDEAQVTAKSHQFFDALDRNDVAAVRAALGPSFGMFSEARFSEASVVLEGLQMRIDHHAPVHSRTWQDERVFRGPNVAVFVGHTIEKVPADGERPAAERDGYATLVWVADRGAWQVAHWQWSRAGLEAERERWNDWLVTGNFNRKPNQLLVDSVKGHKAGSALDLAMGQGRNALFLASEGWKVTGVDISDVGIRIAREEAQRRKLALDTIQHDIDTYDLGTERWDLVTMIYAGSDLKLVARIQPSVKHGGLFVTEYFAADSDLTKGGAGGWDPAQLATAFGSGWKILRNDHIDDNADWAGQRKMKLVRFVAQKL
jgi:SAM-dependent methyltransferase